MFILSLRSSFLIIIDIMLPKINGLDVLRTIRKVYDKVPILMISALNDKESIIKQLREQKAYFKNILDDSFDMIFVSVVKQVVNKFGTDGINNLYSVVVKQRKLGKF